MYTLSKFIWIIFSPINFLVILIFLYLLFSFLKKRYFSLFFLYSSLAFFIIVAVFPTGDFLLYNLEKKYQSKPEYSLPNNIDGLLILGGPTNYKLTHLHNQVSFNESAERLTEALKIIRLHKPKKIIFTGGSSKKNFKSSHAYVVKKFFSEMGIDVSQIIFEFKSRNTYENIVFSKKIVNPKNTENWIVISSSFHMRRVINISDQLDWKLIPYPVDFRVGKSFSLMPNINFLKNINSFNLGSHEIIGLISYYFLGRSKKLF